MNEVADLRKIYSEQQISDAVICVVTKHFGYPKSVIKKGKAHRRSQSVAHSRFIAAYLTHVEFSIPQERAGLLLGYDRHMVRHACRQIEEKRENPIFDDLIAGLAGSVKARLEAEVAA